MHVCNLVAKRSWVIQLNADEQDDGAWAQKQKTVESLLKIYHNWKWINVFPYIQENTGKKNVRLSFPLRNCSFHEKS